jgi:hypothetical protein
MYKSILSVIIVLSLVISLSRCTAIQLCPDKESFIKSLDDAVSSFSDNDSQELSAQDWAEIDEEVKELLDVCYMKHKEELTLTNKIDVIKNLMVYEVHRDISDLNLESFDLNEELEELGANGAREIERFVKEELGETLENTIDDVLNGINDLGEELKRWLKE